MKRRGVNRTDVARNAGFHAQSLAVTTDMSADATQKAPTVESGISSQIASPDVISPMLPIAAPARRKMGAAGPHPAGGRGCAASTKLCCATNAQLVAEKHLIRTLTASSPPASSSDARSAATPRWRPAWASARRVSCHVSGIPPAS